MLHARHTRKSFFFARNNFLFNHRNETNVIRERKIRMVNVTKCSVDDENKFCQDLLLLRLARKMFLFQSNEKIHLWANYCYWWLQISDTSNLVLSFFSKENENKFEISLFQVTHINQIIPVPLRIKKENGDLSDVMFFSKKSNKISE